MKRRLISCITASILVLSLVGCNTQTKSTNQSKVDNNSKDKTATSTSAVENTVSSSDISYSVLNSIASFSAASASMNETYASPQYNLSKDYVFEFDASDVAGANVYNAFSVYDSTEFTDTYKRNFAICKYSNGKITVSPNVVTELTREGEKTITEGTWGSLNTLYLVQNIDLQTGQELNNPIVTPFSIRHDLVAPTVRQSVSKEGIYTLTWDNIGGATEYWVYRLSDGYYSLQCTTSNTSVTSNDLKDQQRQNNYQELIQSDLQNAGYTYGTSGDLTLNSSIDAGESYVVVAANSSAKSGISNQVEVSDIANQIPYVVSDNTPSYTINSMSDVPTYVNVQMRDGTIAQMLLDYHGAQTYRDSTNPNYVKIDVGVANTSFSRFPLTLTGMDYDEFMSNVSYVTEREDSLNIGSGSDTTMPAISVPSVKESEETTEQPSQEASSTESSNNNNENRHDLSIIDEPSSEERASENNVEQPSSQVTEQESGYSQPESSTPESSEVQPSSESESTTNPNPVDTTENADYSAAVNLMNSRLQEIGWDEQLLYANNQLEAWLAYSLITNIEIVPIPLDIYPEAVNTDYLITLWYEAYRQNPTSGFVDIYNIQAYYVEEINTLYFVQPFAETWEVRGNKATQEISKAKALASQLVTSGMSQADALIAINNYICDNSYYDESGVVNYDTVSQMPATYIDCHTPYGILCNGAGVCESYAESLALIARFAGIETVMDVGTLASSGNHEWNKAKADGSWVIVDATNNDNEEIPNALLNLSDSQASGTLISSNSAFLTTLSATDTTKEYYYKNNMTSSSISEAAKMLNDQLSSKSLALVRYNGTLDATTANSIATEIYTSYGTVFTAYGTWAGIMLVQK
jgi:hypothetical protein